MESFIDDRAMTAQSLAGLIRWRHGFEQGAAWLARRSRPRQASKFTVDLKEFVGWFGLELAETVVDELLGTNKIEPSRN